MTNLIGMIAGIVYALGGAYTMGRALRVEKYYNEACGDDERMPFLLLLACGLVWPTVLPTIIITTRKDRVP